MLEIQKKLSTPFLILLALPVTAMGLGLSMQNAVLTWVLITEYNLSPKDVGIVWSVGPIAAIFGTIIIGALSDKTWFIGGRRKPYIIVGGICTALAYFALPNIGFIAQSIGVFTILATAIAVSLFIDLSINTSFNPTRSLVADVTPIGKKRAQAFLWAQTISGAVTGISLAIGALFGNYILIYAGAIAIVFMMIVPILFIKEPRQLQLKDTRSKVTFSLTETILIIRPLWGLGIYAIYAMVLNFADLPTVIWLEVLIIIIAFYFLFETAFRHSNSKVSNNIFQFQRNLAANSVNWFGPFTIFIFLVALLKYRMPELDDKSLGSINNWALFIFNGVAIFLPMLVLNRFVEKYGSLATHIGALWTMVAALILLYFCGYNSYVIWGIMLLAGIAWSSMITLPFALYSQFADPHRMGYFTGVYNLSMIFAGLITSLRFGEFMENAENKGLIYLIAAGMVFLSIVFWSRLKSSIASKTSPS